MPPPSPVVWLKKLYFPYLGKNVYDESKFHLSRWVKESGKISDLRAEFDESSKCASSSHFVAKKENQQLFQIDNIHTFW